METDTKGLVGMVEVSMRPRDAIERTLPYKSKALKNLRLAVQRLVLICPADNTWKILKNTKTMPSTRSRSTTMTMSMAGQCVFTNTTANGDYKNNADIVNETLPTKATIIVDTSTNRARKQEFPNNT